MSIGIHLFTRNEGTLLKVMANNGSYSNDRSSVVGGDIDYASDPASGGFFNSDYKKHDDLKQMLDSNKDGLKLEAMKRIIGMVAKGRDASELFPAVVKNVVSKNIEVKKLVYVYLVRYAEEQQDLALLSISTFQRALKDPNQLIRASALRVLSSIRVPVIVPIVMLAIKDSASDMSPYVRKTAAHAIPKLYSLDPTQKDELILVIEKLLSDKTTLVVGSAVMAFEEVCPERIDLIHKNFRKLCNLLVDVDEWGQVVIINMLTRYARTQFLDPQLGKEDDYDEDKPFYDEEDDENEIIDKELKDKKIHIIDPDHRLLLRNAKPLLQSRNAAVVMGIAQLYHHLAPRMEVSIIAKSLVRLLRSHREVQSIVLNCIATISTERKGLFEPFLKSFFVLTSDPTHIKLLKLEILTNLATETSISVILREFQTYISSPDKEFVAAAIQAIGRCASNIKEVTDSCLSGLVSLLSNRDEAVVAESVVVIKKLLQSQPSRHRDIIRSMAKLVDHITVPAARASILWLLGEYSELVPTIAPDVLRKMAKSFINEEDIVKLQILNLAVKLYLTNPTQTTLLCQYVFSLARYDQNYDIRDRSRFLRQFIFPSNGENKLAPFAKKIFLATKPAPLLQSKFKDREAFQMGSLSQYLNMRAVGYHDLPPFPEEAPDPSARNVSVPSPPSPFTEPIISSNKKKQSKKKSFYSDSESSVHEANTDSEEGKDDDEEDSDEDEDDEEEEDSSSDSSSDEESESDSDDQQINDIKDKEKNQTKRIIARDSGSDDDSSSSSGDTESDSSDDQPSANVTSTRNHNINKQTNQSNQKSNLDLLLDLDDIVPNTPVMTPSLGGFLTPLSPSSNVNTPSSTSIQVTNPSYVPIKKTEVLNKVSGQGLVVESRFTRQPHLYSDKMTSVELTLTNHSPSTVLTNISVSEKVVGSNMAFCGFGTIPSIGEGSSMLVTLGLDWNDSTQAAVLGLKWDQGSANICLRPALGELLRPVNISLETFITNQGQLRGMNEHSALINLSNSQKSLSQRIFEVTNVAALPQSDSNITRFAGQTVSSKSLVLITIKYAPPEASKTEIIVNCEKMVVGSMLLNELKTALS